MTQTVQTTTQESTMYIPPTVLGIILDTGNPKQRETLKALTQAFLQLIPRPEYVGAFLIATCDGVAYPLSVNSETFERQWKEIPWGKKSDVTPGLQMMQTVMREHMKPHAPTPTFRTLLLTASPPVERGAFQAALQQLGRVEIGVVGEGETQLQAYTSYLDTVYTGQPVTVSLIEGSGNLPYWAARLFHALD